MKNKRKGKTDKFVDHDQQPNTGEVDRIVIPFNLEVAFVWVGVYSARIVDVSVDNSDVGESLRRNFIQPSADVELESGIAGRGVVEYIRSVDLDDFQHLKKISEINECTNGMYADEKTARFVGSL